MRATQIGDCGQIWGVGGGTGLDQRREEIIETDYAQPKVSPPSLKRILKII